MRVAVVLLDPWPRTSRPRRQDRLRLVPAVTSERPPGRRPEGVEDLAGSASGMRPVEVVRDGEGVGRPRPKRDATARWRRPPDVGTMPSSTARRSSSWSKVSSSGSSSARRATPASTAGRELGLDGVRGTPSTSASEVERERRADHGGRSQSSSSVRAGRPCRRRSMAAAAATGSFGASSEKPADPGACSSRKPSITAVT